MTYKLNHIIDKIHTVIKCMLYELLVQSVTLLLHQLSYLVRAYGTCTLVEYCTGALAGMGCFVTAGVGAALVGTSGMIDSEFYSEVGTAGTGAGSTSTTYVLCSD